MSKIATTIDQSRQLAKILPIESADMYWSNSSIRGVDYVDAFYLGLSPYKDVVNTSWAESYKSINPMFEVVPAWSLAALMSILPVIIGDVLSENALRLRIDKSETDFNVWYDNLDSGIVEEGLDIIESNPVDACYETILKLHEQKLI